MIPSVTFNSYFFGGTAAQTQSWTADKDGVAVVTVPFGDAVISSDPKVTAADFNTLNSAVVWMEKIRVSTNSGVINIPFSEGETIYVALSQTSTVVFQLYY